MDDTISRQAATQTALEFIVEYLGGAFDEDLQKKLTERMNTLPSAQPEQQNARKFKGTIVEYLSISTYPEYEGKPYISIKYTEDGQDFIGHGTYNPDLLEERMPESAQNVSESDAIYRKDAIEAMSESLKRVFPEHRQISEKCLNALPSAQPEQRWIPCSEETGDGYPEKDGFYYVTEQNYGFYLDADCKQRVMHISHFKNGDFTDRFYTENNSNITAWMPLPEPYEGKKE